MFEHPDVTFQHPGVFTGKSLTFFFEKYLFNLYLKNSDIMIREINVADAGQICGIYNYYIENTVITFELEPVDVAEMTRRILEITKVYPWIVYEENGEIIGYAYASGWRSRPAYRSTAETTVYLKKGYEHKGIGSELYRELLNRMKLRKFRIAIGCITMPNDASVLLHEKFGFTKVGHFPEVGYKFEQWLDVGFWQLML